MFRARTTALLVGTALLLLTGATTAVPAAQASYRRECKPRWVANHGYRVTRLTTFDLLCSSAVRVLHRLISTGRVPRGWREYEPGAPYAGGLMRTGRGSRGAFAFNGYYRRDEP